MYCMLPGKKLNGYSYVVHAMYYVNVLRRWFAVRSWLSMTTV